MAVNTYFSRQAWRSVREADDLHLFTLACDAGLVGRRCACWDFDAPFDYYGANWIPSPVAWVFFSKI